MAGEMSLEVTTNHTGDYVVPTNLVQYWNDFQTTSVPNVWYYPTYPTTVYEDKGKKAFEIVKALSNKKLVDVKSGKQFIELMEAILAVI